MERLKGFFSNAVFVIQFLIIFILIFENRVEVPAVLQAFGRLHPVLLHLPIGLLLVTVILLYARKYFEGKSMDELVSLLLHVTALSASLTTIMGLFLSLEGAFAADQLWLHKWLGVALSFLCWALLTVENNLKILKPLGLAGAVLLIFTGHYGANLTHGEDFVWAPLQTEPERVPRVITDSTALFTATIEPIFESKCYGCHNTKKAKGRLVLTSLESIHEGGKNGPLWTPEDAENSLIVERLLLPIDHKEHMPPKDKAQLTEDEINFISLWIDLGADTQQTLSQLSEEDTLRKLASGIIPRYQQLGDPGPKYTFQFASSAKIEKLNLPNRTVFQIAKNEPAVQADFFLRESYDSKYLEELSEIRDQLVSLNLSGMPAGDDDLRTIEKFRNLEVLNLNRTEISGTGLKGIAELPMLRSLSLSGTNVTMDGLRELATSGSLREVYIWNTGIGEADVESLSEEFPLISWHLGYVPDDNEILKLNTPLVKNKGQVLNADEKIMLKHNLPGTEMRFTLDGSDPDSVNSPVYKEPLKMLNYATVKARAFKDGWLSSDVAEFFFFRKGYAPDSAALLTTPDERFQGEGVKTLLDGQKGLPDFYRHPAWIAFRENDLVLQFSFEKQTPTVRNITLSFAHNSYSICLPPEEMELWGGNDPAQLNLITRQKFPEGTRPPKARIEGISMDVPAADFKHYKLVAKPRRKMADGNPKKRQLWLMVDEVFIN